MLYGDYRRKILKFSNVLNTAKRFRVLIICACLFVVALIAALCGVRGIVYDGAPCPESIVYGETLNYRAKAVMASVMYEYADEDGDEWTTVAPVLSGNYKVRPYSRDVLGNPRYGNTYSFSIVKKTVEIRADGTAVYGDEPTLVADLAFSDAVTCSNFTYADKYAETTEVTPDISGIKITDEFGADVTASYEITVVPSEVTFSPRDLTVVAASAEKTYDGTPLTAGGYEISESSLAFDDRLVVNGCEGSRTEAGESANSLVGEVKIYNRLGADVTGRYNIVTADGTLTVLPREIEITAASAEKIYDGTALYTDEISQPQNLVSGHTATVTKVSSLTNAGEIQNTPVVGVRDADGNDMTANYNVKVIAGLLTVRKREITVTTGDMSWQYDGTAHGCTDYYDTVGSVADNEIIRATAVTYLTNVGSAENVCEMRVYNQKTQAETTANYTINVLYGTLTVEKAELHITSDDREWVYDGTAHSYNGYTQVGLARGESIVSVSKSQITEVGNCENIIEVTVNSNGRDTGANYDIYYEWGTLEVTLRRVTVTANGAQKVYDGTALTADGATADNLASGHRLTAKTSGSITDAGSALNKVVEGSVVIYDSVGADVTKNYSVTLADGILRITRRPITVTSPDHEWVYDGEKHYDTAITVTATGGTAGTALVLNHTAKVDTYTTIENVGSVDNGLVVKIYSGEVDKSANYSITYVYGTLTVTPRKITVTTDGAEKVYDGDPLTCKTYKITGELTPAVAKGQTELVTFKGSQTDAGSSQNICDAQIFGADGSVVTDNYAITYVFGTLTVTKRKISVTTVTREWVYDGESHTAAEVEYDEGSLTLVKNHQFIISDEASITDAGEVENTMTVNVNGGNNYVRGNYELSVTYGTLKVTPRPVTLKLNTDIYFTGAPIKERITDPESNFTSLSDYDLLPKSYVSAVIICNDYAIGKTTVYIEEGSVKILTSHYGDDVTNNYEISCAPAEVNIVQRIILVCSDSATKVYDSEPLTCEEYSVYYADSPTDIFTAKGDFMYVGHTLTDLEVSFTGSQTEIGRSKNTFEVTSYKVVDKDGNDVTYGYNVFCYYGELFVTECGTLTVETASASKFYDGDPLTCGDYTYESNLLDGYTFEVTVTGSQTEVGASYNFFTVIVFAPNGTDVTDFTQIYYNEGVLRVYKGSESGDGSGDGDGSGGGNGDLNTSGNIGGGGSDGSDDGDGSGGGSGDGREPVVALRVYSDKGGQVYLRLMSFGDYSGSGWGRANSYGSTIAGVYSMNYLTGIALGYAGCTAAEMQIEVLGNYYYLPYYLATGDYGYEIQSDDVIYNGDSSSVYTTCYYQYDYVAKGAVASLTGNIAEVEKAYREFVYANYLTVPGSTAEYLKTLIAQQGFSLSDPQVVAKVASFVRSAATYNLFYDSSLDAQSDIVVAFLRDYKEGICSHYASAATLLFRTLGIPARYTIGYTGNAVAGQWVDITTDNAHAWVEVYIDGMGWVQVEVTGSSSPSDGEFGELNVDLGVIRPADVIKAYDGSALVANRLADNPYLSALLSRGYTYKVTFGGSQTIVGESESYITEFKLYDPCGRPVLEGVTWETGKGTLTVVPSGSLITIHLYYLNCEYDGNAHSLGANDWYAEGVPQGFTLEFDPSSVSVTDAGELNWDEMRSLPVVLYDENGYDITFNYFIIFADESEEGADGEGITVEPRAIRVTTQTANKEYDGKPLTNGGWWISFGTLCAGHTLDVSVIGTVTDAGTVPNLVGYANIYDENGALVTDNYKIDFAYGSLTVID